MSRLTLLTSALAVIALGAGAIGYADTGRQGEEMRDRGAVAAAPSPVPTPTSLRTADRAMTVARGKGLAAALLRAGVGGLDAALAEQAAGSVAGPAQLWLGEPVGPKARALERLALRLGPGRELVIERQGDGFVRRERVEHVDLTPVRVRLNGGAELASGLVEAGLPRPTRDRLLDALGGDKPMAVDLIVSHEASASGSLYGEPLYLGAVQADGSIRRWIGEQGVLRPLDGVDEVGDGMLRPLPGRVTSNPGLRFHPILRFLRWHRGTDFASPRGTPVQAALEGRVVQAGWQGGYGQTVRLSHPDGSTTLYAHLSEILVADGQSVPRGRVIGKVGASGLATGPHLHFEWRRGGATLVPAFAGGPAGVAAARPGAQAIVQALLSAPYRLPRGDRS